MTCKNCESLERRVAELEAKWRRLWFGGWMDKGPDDELRGLFCEPISPATTDHCGKNETQQGQNTTEPGANTPTSNQ